LDKGSRKATSGRHLFITINLKKERKKSQLNFLPDKLLVGYGWRLLEVVIYNNELAISQLTGT